jgi:hypothetical protein
MIRLFFGGLCLAWTGVVLAQASPAKPSLQKSSGDALHAERAPQAPSEAPAERADSNG